MPRRGKSKNVPGIIYILKFSVPLSHAQYYIGWCEEHRLQARYREHCKGDGACITRAAVQRGIGLVIIHTQPGTRSDERKLKNRKDTPGFVAKLMRDGKLSPPKFG